MDNIKEAFNKVKQDIDSLRFELNEIRLRMIDVLEIVKDFQEKNQQTDRQIIPTHQEETQTNNSRFKPLNGQINPISTGNVGVPTDRQTNQQTDRHMHFTHENTEKRLVEQDSNSIDNAVEILDSLDGIKKEIRLKFKRLTEKELLVFSTLYQLTEQQDSTDYKTISKRLNLTESSIRDYIGKLIKKGIPVEKIKVNNKNIKLSISPNLKKIASLSTILELREL